MIENIQFLRLRQIWCKLDLNHYSFKDKTSSLFQEGGISWCGFLFGLLFLLGAILLFGVLRK